MPLYEHVKSGEKVLAPAGSRDDRLMAARVADPASGWAVLPDPSETPAKPARRAQLVRTAPPEEST